MLQPLEIAYIIAKRTLITDLYLVLARAFYCCEGINVGYALSFADDISKFDMTCVGRVLEHFRRSLPSDHRDVTHMVLLRRAEVEITKSLQECLTEIDATLQSPQYRPEDKDKLKTALLSPGTNRYDRPYPETAGQFLALGEKTWESFRAKIMDKNEWQAQVTGKGWSQNGRIVFGADIVIERTKKLFMA